MDATRAEESTSEQIDQLVARARRAVAELVTDPDVATALVDATDATPFAISEVLRELVARDALVAVPGGYRPCRGDVATLATQLSREGRRRAVRRRAEQHPGAAEVLALVSLLGMTHVERNAHHFVDGMSFASEFEQRAFVRAHRDLYEKTDGHPARLKAPGGKIALSSLAVPGFAVGAEMDFRAMMPRTTGVTTT